MEQRNIPVSRLYVKNIEALLNSGKRYIVNEGGSRSGKSYSIMQVLITQAINQDKISITVTSHSLPHLKRGSYRDFMTIINEMGWYREEWHNKTDGIYTFPNGSYIEFFGLEDPDKARGAGRNILFVNEANLIKKSVFDQLDIRTSDNVFLDLNPSDYDVYCYRIADGDNAVKIHSTYRDNPFLSQVQKNVIESYQFADPMMWQVFGLGLRGVSEEQIYTHWKLTDYIPDGEVVYGLDFGYNVPSALTRVTFHEGNVYVKEMLYQTKLTTNDLVSMLESLGINKTDEIFCDAAEPKTIEELYRNGYNAKPADKDVTEGIRSVKSMPLFIDKYSENLQHELKNYKWKTDKDGKILDEPVKSEDHLCFSGDTLIETINGQKRIDEIQTNDFVLTSKGYRKVNALYNNGKKLVKKYSMLFDTFEITLVCTPNHKVKTNKGWKEISKLQSEMTVYLNNITKVNLSNFNRNRDILTTENIKCTGGYGSKKRGRKDQKATTFITSTTTHGTIESKILNWLNLANTYQNISKRDLRQTRNGLKNFIAKELKQQLFGIKVKRGLNGIENTHKNTILASSIMGKQNVKYAKRNLIRKQIMQNSVIQTAKLKHLECVGSWKEEVYDLNVQEMHEYFANGLLVHNCDSLRYAIFTKQKQPRMTWGII